MAKRLRMRHFPLDWQLGFRQGFGLGFVVGAAATVFIAWAVFRWA
jgi:hypothetical protein